MATAARAVAKATKRVTARAPREMATATKKAMVTAARLMATATKRAMVRAGRGLATATLVAGGKKGNGKSSYGQWLRQRGWWAFNSGNDGDGVKDTAACVMTGERGMMVVMGHGLCVCLGVCGETTKNKEESKIVNDS
jgi:hypothetical protein